MRKDRNKTKFANANLNADTDNKLSSKVISYNENSEIETIETNETNLSEDLNLSQEPFSHEIIKLRQLVLHPSGPVERVMYAKDYERLALHVLIRKDSELVAVGSLLPEDENEAQSFSAWRIRGMAVKPEVQGQGLGSIILNEMFEYLQNIESQTQVQPQLIWCNARIEALNLYTRMGFTALDGEFLIPGSGPHRSLKLHLGANA